MTTLATQYVNYDYNRPPVAVGVKINTQNSDPGAAVTRIMYDATGNYLEGAAVEAIFHVNTGPTPHVSTFDTFDPLTNCATGGPGLMPWCGMVRSMVSYDGNILTSHGEVDDYGNPLFFEGSLSNTMVKIPKCWYKFYVSGNYQYYLISPYPMPGFRLFPAFIRGKWPVDYIMISAYETFMSGSALYSGTNNAPTTNISRVTNRGYAYYTGLIPGGGLIQSWTLPDLQAWELLKWLYLIEYGHLNCQVPSGSTTRGGLSAGIVSGSKQNTGWTGSVAMSSGGFSNIDLGNSSGQVQCAAGPIYAMSYRGIENLWGNTWTQLDFHCLNTARWLWINYNSVTPADYTTAQLINSSVNATYQMTGRQSPASSGYISYLAYDAAYHEPEWCLFPQILSGSATTYFCDYFNAGSAATERYYIVGGCYASGTQGGIFNIDASLAYADAYTSVGSRLMFIPYDLRSTNFYHY